MSDLETISKLQARIKELEERVAILQDMKYQEFAQAYPEFNKLAWRVKELEDTLRYYADESNRDSTGRLPIF